MSIGANDVVHLTSRDAFRAALRRARRPPCRTAPLLVLLGVPDMGAPPRYLQPLRGIAGLRGRQLDEVTRDRRPRAAARSTSTSPARPVPTMRADTDRYFADDRYHPSDDGYAPLGRRRARAARGPRSRSGWADGRSMTSPPAASRPAPPPTSRPGPGYPDEALAAPGRRARHRAGHHRVRPGRRHRQAHPAPGRARRRASWPSSRSTAMRAQLRTAAVPGVEALDGTAEAIPLPDASVDVVTVAQAFHWFDAAAALAEIARVLRPGRRPGHPLERAGRAHGVGGRDEPAHPLARAHRVPLPARRLGRRSSPRRGRFTPLAEQAVPLGPADDAASCSPTGCARSATSPRCRRPSASASPPRSTALVAPAAGAVPAARTSAACSGATGADRARQAAVLGWWERPAPRPALAPDP